MKKYEILIFDLDDTLIDNKRAMEYALHSVMQELNIKPSKKLDEAWHIFDHSYWYLWENGLMEIPEQAKTDINFRITYLRSMRFINFFKKQNIGFETAIHLNEIFTNNLAADIVPIKNAQEVIKELSLDYKIVVATNGPIIPAHTKLDKINILKYIDHIFCSEQIGYSKPFPEFFDYLFSIINIPRSKAILIGDSLTNDVGSGMKNGFDTIWFNPDNKELPIEYKPTIIINDLKELKRKLN